jgi:hypothetical protein
LIIGSPTTINILKKTALHYKNEQYIYINTDQAAEPSVPVVIMGFKRPSFKACETSETDTPYNRHIDRLP